MPKIKEQEEVSLEDDKKEVSKQEQKEKSTVVPEIAKPHNKFAQYISTSKFGGGNKFWNASGKRMGRAAQRGR